MNRTLESEVNVSDYCLFLFIRGKHKREKWQSSFVWNRFGKNRRKNVRWAV